MDRTPPDAAGEARPGVPLVLAPIRGVTDVIYRNAFARCFGGVDRAVAPFIQLKQGHALRPAELRQVEPSANRLMPVVPQVLTHHAPTLGAALRDLQAAGHAEVNWNLGCPYPTVAGRGRGAGLLPHPDRIDAILAAAMAEAPVRVSVKMRLGRHDPDEFKAVMAVLNRYPLAAVILHARTADQMYAGTVDMQRAGEALALCRHPLVFNGDITSLASFLAARARLPGVAGWMVGRGALRDPWLPARLKGAAPVPVGTRRLRLVAFHGLLFEGYGQVLSGAAHRHDRMLAQWEYLSHGFAAPQAVLSRLRRSRPYDYEAAVAWAFDQPLAATPAAEA